MVNHIVSFFLSSLNISAYPIFVCVHFMIDAISSLCQWQCGLACVGGIAEDEDATFMGQVEHIKVIPAVEAQK